ncbi:hypothetical protein PoB_007459000 [Plakobranchus ocellatus]|uniref:Uncharacterized protein n=1 Tax=Plakobranchus ocellatus TaxID=259542 RepID=A0AAV4DVA4_9GAST|nr:hypothetical protein PoB_007459000 [Plakobranchus ocellatus]
MERCIQHLNHGIQASMPAARPDYRASKLYSATIAPQLQHRTIGDQVRLCLTDLSDFHFILLQILTMHDQHCPSWQHHSQTREVSIHEDLSVWAIECLPADLNA